VENGALHSKQRICALGEPEKPMTERKLRARFLSLGEPLVGKTATGITDLREKTPCRSRTSCDCRASVIVSVGAPSEGRLSTASASTPRIGGTAAGKHRRFCDVWSSAPGSL
jgi:hypothetical protein